ncbi:MAG: serine hydrolase [Phormidesmis sp.]
MVQQNRPRRGQTLPSQTLPSRTLSNRARPNRVPKIGAAWLVAIALCSAFLGTLTYVLLDLNQRAASSKLSALAGRTAIDRPPTASASIASTSTVSMPTTGNQVYYSSANPLLLQQNPRLLAIVDEAKNIAMDSGLPTQDLSIKLVDLNTGSFGGFQADKPLFPASVAKLFWLIALFQQYENGKTFGNAISEADLKAMMQDSDNSSASRILDAVTGATSGSNLDPDELEAWLAQRSFINSFYTRAGYGQLNISQKNFPIPDENLEMPSGREQQMRGREDQPVRNFLTTDAIARLLYEIETGTAVNASYSQKAKRLMKRDFATEATKPYDSIRGFIGESLEPYGVSLFSKPGWTSGSRQDAAIVESPDATVRYILVVIGDDAAYAENEAIFPEISDYIYQEMSTQEMSTTNEPDEIDEMGASQ